MNLLKDTITKIKEKTPDTKERKSYNQEKTLLKETLTGILPIASSTCHPEQERPEHALHC